MASEVRLPDKATRRPHSGTVDANIIYDLFRSPDRPNIKTFVLMAGDSDYIRVVARLRNAGTTLSLPGCRAASAATSSRGKYRRQRRAGGTGRNR
jgi:uncharacterized LabA/DUF88 family protein